MSWEKRCDVCSARLVADWPLETCGLCSNILARAKAEGAAEEREAIAARADQLVDFFRRHTEKTTRSRELAPEALERFADYVRARGAKPSRAKCLHGFEYHAECPECCP